MIDKKNFRKQETSACTYRNIVTVLTSDFGHTFKGVGGTQERNLDKVFNLFGLALTQECREGISPTFNVRKTAEDSLDILQSAGILTVVGPVEFNNFGALFFKDFRALFSKRGRISVITITLPLHMTRGEDVLSEVGNMFE